MTNKILENHFISKQLRSLFGLPFHVEVLFVVNLVRNFGSSFVNQIHFHSDKQRLFRSWRICLSNTRDPFYFQNSSFRLITLTISSIFKSLFCFRFLFSARWWSRISVSKQRKLPYARLPNFCRFQSSCSQLVRSRLIILLVSRYFFFFFYKFPSHSSIPMFLCEMCLEFYLAFFFLFQIFLLELCRYSY